MAEIDAAVDRNPGIRAEVGQPGDPASEAARPDADSGPDESCDETGRRLCGYRGCRVLLPSSSGRGNKAKYCQDGKTWGPKQLTCKQAAIALEQVASLTGQATIPDTSITALGEHIAAVLAPTRQLVAALTDVQAQLDAAVTVAQRDRAAALAEAAEQRGLREAAEQGAAAAQQRADDADEAAAAGARRQASAETDRDREIDARCTAERAQVRAEARLEDARDAGRRAENRTDAAAARAGQLDHELVAATAELSAARAALEQGRQRRQVESERANTVIREHSATLEKLRQAHQAQVERLHTEHADVLQAARREAAAETAEATRRVRAEFEQQRRAEAERHAGELAALHQQIGGLRRQVGADTAPLIGGQLDITPHCGDMPAARRRCGEPIDP